MGKTYRAILEGDRLHWEGDAPVVTDPVPVSVTVEEADAEALPDEPNGARLAALFEELARLDPFRDIKDPVAWQREIRKDRPLPGRELPPDD